MLSLDRSERAEAEEVVGLEPAFEALRLPERKASEAELLQRLPSAHGRNERLRKIASAYAADAGERDTVRPGRPESVERQPGESLAHELSLAWERLDQRRERLAGKKEFAKTSFAAGGLAVEGQEVSCVDYPTELRLSFRLADHHYQTIIQGVKECGAADKLSFRSAINEKKQVTLKDAYAVQENGIKMRVAAPMGKVGEALRSTFSVPIDKMSETLVGLFFAQPYVGARGHAADRLVTISIPKPPSGETPDFETVAETVNGLLKGRLDMERGLDGPNEKEEGVIKQFAYAEHHRLGAEEVTQEQAATLRREEVFPGHSAYVQEGRHREYQQISPYVIYHRIAMGATVKRARDTIVEVLRGDGLMSTTERLSRGIIFEGASSASDIGTGGADSAFTRLVTRDGAKDKKINEGGGYKLILDPALLDRTDWYAYTSDKYGSKDPEWYNNRLSPEGFLEVMKERHRSTNEVMFPGGVPKERVLGVQCDSEKDRAKLLEDLRAAGVQEVRGKPIEDFVYVGTMRDSIQRFQKDTPSEEPIV